MILKEIFSQLKALGNEKMFTQNKKKAQVITSLVFD